MKKYKVIKFDCYVDYQKELEKLLNEMAEKGWTLKMLFRSSSAFPDAIFEK